MQQEIIRTTARFQDAAEPARLRPCIIQVEEAAETRANQQQLPNTVRASMDSQGRDNPFRPDGKIYKSADPIVDYYKHGVNQSRTQSPAEALLGSGLAEEKRKNKMDSNRKNKKTNVAKGERDSCWRRWLCCSCCCCWCKSRQAAIKSDNESVVISKQTKLVVVEQTNSALEEPSHDHDRQKEQYPKKQQVSTTKTKPKTTTTTTTRRKNTQEEEENSHQLNNESNNKSESKCLIS